MYNRIKILATLRMYINHNNILTPRLQMHLNLENKLEMFKENESDISMSEMTEFADSNNVSKRKRLQTLNSADLASIDFGNDVHETVDEVRVDKLLMFQDSDSSDAFDGIEDDFASELKRNTNKSEDINFDDFSDKDDDSENEVG